MIIDEDDYLMHYGVLRRSGRYPWGSGGPEYASNDSFLGYVKELRSQGLSETLIAQNMGLTTTELRAASSIAKNEKRAADISQARRLKEHGLSNVAIGEKMGINESSVRSLLAPSAEARADILTSTAAMLKKSVDEGGFVDVGAGVENGLHISEVRLKNSLAILEQEGYVVTKVQVPQLAGNNKTTIRVLAPPGTTYRDIVTNMDQIKPLNQRTDDGGRTWDSGVRPPLHVDPKRVGVRYKEEGGDTADGVIYVRPGVDDLSLGAANYAQVRIAVGENRYLKGMAMYKDDLPEGVDLMFNTNKSDTGNKLDAMKKMNLKEDGTVDTDNPFGATIKPQLKDSKGNVKSAMNIVNEEGDWDRWSRNLSTQMLSKQSPQLIKTQLDLTYEQRRADLEEILSLTNPVVKQKLLESYADGADSAAVHLKAAAMPRQRSQVILPINSLKDNEIYAPNFKDGERVVLIRYPHGGIFEIPELVVNNKRPEGKKSLGNAIDAIGINSKVASRLSGADFDGDTVLVIPNNSGRVRTKAPLDRLKGFDPQSAYPAYEGMPKMTARTKGIQMGLVSNLITDMTIKGASDDELARAVRHSMVVIDAEKHNLNYKQSSKDNGIPALMQKYQGRSAGGAATLISRAGRETDVAERKVRYRIDPDTGKKIYIETGAEYVNKKGEVVKKTSKVDLLGEVDARTLSSGTRPENLYADHSNRMKALGDQARKEQVATKNTPYSPAAKKTYAVEVKRLGAAVDIARQNKPLERQALLLANQAVDARKKANPAMEKDELKKIKSQELARARVITGAKRNQITISEREWEAIQAGAISANQLKAILDSADLDQVKSLATPRTNTVMTPVATRRAQAMATSGYTQAEISEALGIPVSTIQSSLKG